MSTGLYHILRKKARMVGPDRGTLGWEVKTMEKKKEKPIITDPMGSYTGRPQQPGERPVQDADDL